MARTREEAWARLLTRVSEDGDCLLIAHLKGRYGMTRDGYKQILMHRFAYEQYHGVRLTPNKVIMHSCDQPACIAREHLVKGTQLENMQDKIRKGRHKRDERYIQDHEVLELNLNLELDL